GVGVWVGNGDQVRVGGALSHRPGGEPGESRSPAGEHVHRLDRDHLGARLAVHIHEHGEEELDAVFLGFCPEQRFRFRHVARSSSLVVTGWRVTAIDRGTLRQAEDAEPLRREALEWAMFPYLIRFRDRTSRARDL